MRCLVLAGVPAEVAGGAGGVGSRPGTPRPLVATAGCRAQVSPSLAAAAGVSDAGGRPSRPVARKVLGPHRRRWRGREAPEPPGPCLGPSAALGPPFPQGGSPGAASARRPRALLPAGRRSLRTARASPRPPPAGALGAAPCLPGRGGQMSPGDFLGSSHGLWAPRSTSAASAGRGEGVRQMLIGSSRAFPQASRLCKSSSECS
ncbi:translation initiation factor IF-2-like [Lemur catta]|uniref:translation initiation factor IF-2-like n=1 Tax=Lemur catta TaxID=9447 RepID=UPI001E26B82C|nr:translation initiation factor IF-2-like [Lemur catta]